MATIGHRGEFYFRHGARPLLRRSSSHTSGRKPPSRDATAPRPQKRNGMAEAAELPSPRRAGSGALQRQRGKRLFRDRSGPSPIFSEHTDAVGTSAIDGHVVRSRHAVTEPDRRPTAGHIHETAAQLFATDRIRCDPACAARSEGTRRAYTGTNLPKNRPKARGRLPIHTIHQTGAVRMINFEFRQRTDESALLEKGFLPVSARSDLLPESGRRFRSDEVRLRPQDSDTVPGNVFFISRRGGTHPTPTIRPARQVKSDSVAAGHGTTCRRVVFVNIRKPAAPKRTND